MMNGKIRTRQGCRGIMKNKRGIYEYVLTKSVMLIFILSLVFLFYSFYNQLNIKSAGTVANTEAQRIAKIIDDTIGFTGIETENTILINNRLKVGDEVVPYDLEISNRVVVIRLRHHEYLDVVGSASFGQGRLEPTVAGKNDNIDCEWDQILLGAQITVSKTDGYKFVTTPDGHGQSIYFVDVTIDAAESCYELMNLHAEYEHGDPV